MGMELLQKIAEAMDFGGDAEKKKDKPKEDSGKPKEEKKKGENPFAKKKEDGGEEKPADPNTKEGAPPAEKPAEVTPPTEGGPAPANGEAPVEMAPEGAAPTQGGQIGISQIIDFLQANPQPDVNSVRSFAEQSGMDPEQLEGMIFGLSVKAVNLLRGGSSVGMDPSSVDPNELEMGIQREMQTHTPDKSIAKKITLDNLSVMPNFYTRLQAMEQQSSEESNAAAVPKQGGNISDVYNQDDEEKKENDPNQPVGANNRSEL